VGRGGEGGRIIGENNVDRVRTWVTVVCDGRRGGPLAPRYFYLSLFAKKNFILCRIYDCVCPKLLYFS
jgi:hypothetical protein